MFSNKLIERILNQVPDVLPMLVIQSGATNFNDKLTRDEAVLVVHIFIDSLKDV